MRIYRRQYISKSILGISILILIGGGVYITTKMNGSAMKNVTVMHFSYITDFSDDKKLLGASHNVIVGKVIAKKGTVRFPGDMPGEVFQIQVLDTIKGTKKGLISVIKEGGCLDGKCYVLEGDIGKETTSLPEGLQIGATYILAMREDERFGDIIISHPSGKSQISDTGDIKKNARIHSLKKAYTEEILFEGDILAKKAINSFEKLPPQEKEVLQKSLQQ